MKLAALVVTLAAVLVGSASAAAATHADPAGDNCKLFGPNQWCGFDISSASDVSDANGTVHLQLTYPAKTCDGNGISQESRPSFEIYDTTATVPVPVGPHLVALLHGTFSGGYEMQGLSTTPPTTTPLTATTTVSGATTTFDVAIPSATAGTLGAFRWLGSNTCIGELPQNASDIAPNAGLYDHAGGGVTLAAITSAVKGTLAAAKAKSATTLLKKGGFPITFKAPGGGTFKATLTTGASGSGANAVKTVTIATLKLTLSKAGEVTRTVKLTSAGRKLLKNAKKTLSAKLTISFKAGALTSTKSRISKISPNVHRSSRTPGLVPGVIPIGVG
jgi:hypothetical protein